MYFISEQFIRYMFLQIPWPPKYTFSSTNMTTLIKVKKQNYTPIKI